METKDYWIYENKIIFKPKFNAKLDNYFDIISKYNELIFSNYDDYNITIKTNNRYYREYDKNYKLSKFNQQVIIPQNVTHLTFGYYFNQKVNLPNIKYIKLDCNNIDIIENLPNSVEEIEFDYNFNLELQNLPNSIKKISFDCYSKYDKELNCLPESVEYLKLNISYDKRIKKFPLNLKTIKCNEIYIYIDDFKDKYNVIIL